VELRTYQSVIAYEPEPTPMEEIQMLARHLRFLTQMARVRGYTLEELASLDLEVT
jgi:hypothetical protein